MTKKEFKSSIEGFLVSKIGLKGVDLLPYNFDKLLDSVIQTAIAEHEQAQWKAYPENKPEGDGDYYVCLKSGKHVQFYWMDKAHNSWDYENIVIAFRPLPEPYKTDKP